MDIEYVSTGFYHIQDEIKRKLLKWSVLTGVIFKPHARVECDHGYKFKLCF